MIIPIALILGLLGGVVAGRFLRSGSLVLCGAVCLLPTILEFFLVDAKLVPSLLGGTAISLAGAFLFASFQRARNG